ncbi:MAG: O-antigen ligase family protein [Proteobacteria bacterium]|nr:O-antigen ligase family protein [Pseudomonadota bacterium]
MLPLLVVLSAKGVGAFAELMANPQRRWSRVLVVALWAATGFVGGVFVLTQSREAYLGLALALAVMAMISLRAFIRLRAAHRLLLLIGTVTAVGLAAFVVARVRPERLADAVFGASQFGEGALSVQSLSSRLELWSRAQYAIQDFPFTGLGMGTFQPVVNVLYPLFMIGSETEFVHPHNHLLSAAVDLGIPGLIAYISIWLGAAWLGAA